MKSYRVYDDNESLYKTTEALVADGEKYLDLAAEQGIINKDWRSNIDLDTLDLYSSENCILAQIWGEGDDVFHEAAIYLAYNLEIGHHTDLQYIQDCLKSYSKDFPKTPKTRLCGFYMEWRDIPVAEQLATLEPFYSKLIEEWKEVLKLNGASYKKEHNDYA